MNTYTETLDYLYQSTPVFQHIGAQAYKPGLDNTVALCHIAGNPHEQFQSIHIGGTNGKGSTSHLIAAILQAAGYRVGLYTSPHLVDFRERIRINGAMIEKQYVVDYIAKHKTAFETVHPSFFELTMTMAFSYFAEQKIDIAVVEVGLGGRLDSTNILSPQLSIITNISLDHQNLLGDTLEKIAFEKAGIIKPYTPTIIGEQLPSTRPVFDQAAQTANAPIRYADEEQLADNYPDLTCALAGLCQQKNRNTVLTAIDALRRIGLSIPATAVNDGFMRVTELTGLRGRWDVVSKTPFIVCDTGHNEAGIKQIVEQLQSMNFAKLHLVFGMSNDKDPESILRLLPASARFYWTKASVVRALDPDQLASQAEAFGLYGSVFKTVEEAYRAARAVVAPDEAIYIGGSSFVVADFLSL